jgi:hypothetical protein
MDNGFTEYVYPYSDLLFVVVEKTIEVINKALQSRPNKDDDDVVE